MTQNKVFPDARGQSTYLDHSGHIAMAPLIRSHDPESMQAWVVTREVKRVGLRDDALTNALEFQVGSKVVVGKKIEIFL